MGYSSTDTQKMIYQVIDAMGDSFMEGNTVIVQNFGSFEVKKRLERIIVNPTTGQRMLVPPKLTLGFKISPTWKGKLKNGGTDLKAQHQFRWYKHPLARRWTDHDAFQFLFHLKATKVLDADAIALQKSVSHSINHLVDHFLRIFGRIA